MVETSSARPVILDFGFAKRTGLLDPEYTKHLGGTQDFIDPELMAIFDEQFHQSERNIDVTDPNRNIIYAHIASMLISQGTGYSLNGISIPLELPSSRFSVGSMTGIRHQFERTKLGIFACSLGD